jgi:dTDP-4-dehydrorhamnose reductase
VLVTGAAGQLGRALVAAAPDLCECIAVDRSELDLADAAAIRRTVARYSPDVVINAAAYTAVDRAESEEPLARAINANAVGTLAEALEEAGGRLVHVSTDYVFDGNSSQPYRPEDTRNPQSAYGRSKAAGEDAAGPDAAIVRTAWVYDAGGANFVSTMLRLMRERDEVRVVADQIGAPTWTAGLAQALWRLALREASGVFHYSDAGVASWYDFAVAVQEEALARGLLDRSVPVVPIRTTDYPTPARRPAFSLLDSNAMRAELDLPPVHWRTNLRAALDQLAALS